MSGTLTADAVLALMLPLAGKSGSIARTQWDALAECLITLLQAGYVPVDGPEVLGTGIHPVSFPGARTKDDYVFKPYVRETISLPRNWSLQTTSPGAATHEAVHYAPNHGPADRRIAFIPRGPLYAPFARAVVSAAD